MLERRDKATGNGEDGVVLWRWRSCHGGSCVRHGSLAWPSETANFLLDIEKLGDREGKKQRGSCVPNGKAAM